MTDSPKFSPWFRARIALFILLVLTACAPALNWREIRPAEAQGLVALFPCKPETAERRLTVPGLDGGPVTVHLLSCQAGGLTWALSYLDAGTPERLAQALPALDHALWVNLSAGDTVHAHRQPLGPSLVRGAHQHPGARVWLLEGTRPVSTSRLVPVRVKAWSFARGLSAFQASVWMDTAHGALQVDDPGAEAFAQGFNFPP